ncbi:hypothetical protein DPX16_19965 [Anabarilius grahami]|uniref:Uncharacterized protein n=1 Tax=Anabarilius grahami TaxID=495550 RepID=A0A3N0XRR8_ANAGA|nr:hypothetical protein DPX16_19965 [Anabarilius grahami]
MIYQINALIIRQLRAPTPKAALNNLPESLTPSHGGATCKITWKMKDLQQNTLCTGSNSSASHEPGQDGPPPAFHSQPRLMAVRFRAANSRLSRNNPLH